MKSTSFNKKYCPGCKQDKSIDEFKHNAKFCIKCSVTTKAEIDEDHRRCPQCEQIKHVDEFYKQKNGKYYDWCKECKKNHQRYRSRNRPQPRLADYTATERAKDKAFILKRMFGNAKRRAREEDKTFTITIDDFILPDYCPVYGMLLDYNPDGKQHDWSPSIDRVDNTKGYEPGNVIVVSWKANKVKGSLTLLQIVEQWVLDDEQEEVTTEDKKRMLDFYTMLTLVRKSGT